jgi:hypothetical protein
VRRPAGHRRRRRAQGAGAAEPLQLN